MIDTVRFDIPLTRAFLDDLESSGVSLLKLDNLNGDTLSESVLHQVNVPSWDNYLRLFYDRKNQRCSLELSLPKYEYGHNVYMLSCDQNFDVLEDLRDRLSLQFPKIPPLSTWTLKRIDCCFAWRLDDRQSLLSTLEILKDIDYPRHKKQIYDTSVMWVGRYLTLKFYDKFTEYKKHDYTRLKKINPDLANSVLNTSEKVLRFEVTLRGSVMLQNLGKNVNVLFEHDKIEKTLQKYLGNFREMKIRKVDNYTTAMDNLLNRFKPTKAIKLYQFWLSWYSGGACHRELLSKHYSRSQIWRNHRDLRIADVGILSTSDMPILTVPSTFSVS